MNDAKEIVNYFDRHGFCIAIHAEVAAIEYYRSINRYRPRGKVCIIVVRFDNNGNFIESKPCSDCISAMSDFGVHSVKYSTADGTLVTKKLKHIDSTESKGFKTMRAIYRMAKEFVSNNKDL